MTTFQKVAMGVVMVAALTTLVYPTHQTPAVINAASNLTQGTLKTAEGI
jgi:hypothetical protein